MRTDRRREPRGAEERPDRLRLADERLRDGRVVEQDDAAVAARDRLEPGLDRVHVSRRLAVDLAQERLAEVGQLGAGEAADEALHTDDPHVGAVHVQDRRSRGRGARSPRRAGRRRPRRSGSRGSRGCRARRRPAARGRGTASASTSACSGSPCVVRSPASRTRSTLPRRLGERLHDPVAERLGAVDVACGCDAERPVHRQLGLPPRVRLANSPPGYLRHHAVHPARELPRADRVDEEGCCAAA